MLNTEHFVVCLLSDWYPYVDTPTTVYISANMNQPIVIGKCISSYIDHVKRIVIDLQQFSKELLSHVSK